MTNPIQLLEQGVVIGSDGDDIGKVGQVFLDNETGEPSWVTVKTGWFGAKESFVPLDNASVNGDTVTVPYDKDMIKGAPNFDADAPLSEQDEQDLYTYYGVTGTAGYDASYAGTPQTAVDVDTTRATAPAAAGEYLTRSEEQLRVGTEKVQTGKARLRKFVVTEQQTVTVPVSREEVQVVREPLAPGDSIGGATIGEDVIEVDLTEDRVVVNKDVVGVEKVRLGTETVTEQREVTEAVRKEQIEFDDSSSSVRDELLTAKDTAAGKR